MDLRDERRLGGEEKNFCPCPASKPNHPDRGLFTTLTMLPVYRHNLCNYCFRSFSQTLQENLGTGEKEDIKKLRNDLKGTRECWAFKETATEGTLCRTRCGRGYGPVVKQTTE